MNYMDDVGTYKSVFNPDKVQETEDRILDHNEDIRRIEKKRNHLLKYNLDFAIHYDLWMNRKFDVGDNVRIGEPFDRDYWNREDKEYTIEEVIIERLRQFPPMYRFVGLDLALQETCLTKSET